MALMNGLESKEQSSFAREHDFNLLVKQAPVPIAIFRGKNFVAQTANDAYLAVVDKRPEDFIGLPIFESLPEVRPVVEPIVRDLMRTGKAFVTEEIGTWLTRNGEKRYAYFKLVYEPLFNPDGVADGFMVIANEVTEQVVARKSAQESEARLKAIIEATPDCIKIVDGDGVLQYMNTSGLAMIEGDASLISKACVYDVIAPEHRQEWIDRHTQVVNGKSLSWEFEIVGLNGTRRYMETHAVPLKVGEKVSQLAVTRDVSERKEAEERLRLAKVESEKRRRLYEAVTGTTLDLMYIFDLNYNFIYANEALLGMWGLSWEKSIGKSLRQVGYEDWHADMHHREIDTVVATKKPIRGEVSFPHATLGRRIYDYIFTPVLDENGNVEAVAGTTRDITEIKNAETALKESEAKFRRFYESNMLAIAFWNVSGKVYDCNEAFAELVDVPRKQIISGQYDWMAGTAPEFRFLNDKFVNEAIHSQIFVRPYEIELLRSDGSRISALIGYTMLERSSENGVAFLMDITAQKSMLSALEYRVAERTKELNEANQALKQSNDDLLQFAHVASHDLKEPVRKIKTFGNRLQDELPEGSGKSKGYLDKMMSSASRMSTMIDGILSYSSINTAPDSVDQVDLNLVFEDIKNDLEVVIAQKNAIVNFPLLPVINGNRFLLHQLFYNLINNALKFSRAGTVPVVDVLCNVFKTEHGSIVTISIKDNGIGFNQSNAGRIFDTFARLNPKDMYEGTGLGLALCKKIIQRHNGSIRAFGEEGGGATFEVTLPVEKEKAI